MAACLAVVVVAAAVFVEGRGRRVVRALVQYNSLSQVGGDGWTLGAGREQLHRYLDFFGGALGCEPGVQWSFLV